MRAIGNFKAFVVGVVVSVVGTATTQDARAETFEQSEVSRLPTAPFLDTNYGTKAPYNDCGLACKYQRGSEAASQGADYALGVAEDIKAARENNGFYTDLIPEGYCDSIDEKDKGTCADTYATLKAEEARGFRRAIVV